MVNGFLDHVNFDSFDGFVMSAAKKRGGPELVEYVTDHGPERHGPSR